jgi:hypothetical protein
MLRCEGVAVRVTNYPWSKDNRSGVTRTVRVLVGQADFADLTLPDDAPSPAQGELVDYAVDPRVSGTRLRLVAVGLYNVVVSPIPGAGSAKS